MIRTVCLEDALRIGEIYNHYVRNTAISFETEAVGVTDIAQRIEKIVGAGYPYYVYELEGKVVGYAYLSSWKDRSAYRTTAEVSIYIDKDCLKRGIGKILMQHLIDNLENSGFHAIVACITMPNILSVALHEKFGFKQISHFREIGCKFGQWQDVGHWLLILNNTSCQSCPK